MEDKICAFLIRNTAVGIIWILASFEVNNQALIFWSVSVFFQRIVQSFRANDE